MPYSTNTVVRTTTGEKPLAEVVVGDLLLDEQNNPVLVTEAGPPVQGPLHIIEFAPYDTNGGTKVRIGITAQQDLIYTASGVKITHQTHKASGEMRGVLWYSRCVPGGHQSSLKADVDDMKMEQDEADMLEEYNESQIGTQADAPIVIVDDDDEEEDVTMTFNTPAASPNAAASSSSPHSPHHHIILEDEDDDNLDVPGGSQQSAAPSSSPDGAYMPPSSQGSNASSIQSISELSSAQVFNNMSDTLLATIESTKQRLSTSNTCDCMGFRGLTTTCASLADAHLFKLILSSPQHSSIIDANVVYAGDVMLSKPDMLCNAKHNPFNQNKLKVYRCPLDRVQGNMLLTENTLPLPPYWLGAFLGDGQASSTGIFSGANDVEMEVYLNKLVGDLNRNRPAGTRPITLSKDLRTRAGDWQPNIQCYAKQDVYLFRIVRGASDVPGVAWNPIRTEMTNLNLFNNKHVPAVYMNASEEARLALIAGMIDTDGHYDVQNRCFSIGQSEAHVNILQALHEIAIGLGIGSHLRSRIILNLQNNPITRWDLILNGQRATLLNPYIIFPRKRLSEDINFANRDTRTFEILEPAETVAEEAGDVVEDEVIAEAEETGNQSGDEMQEKAVAEQPVIETYREIKVAGSLFQHATRTILHC